MSDIIGIGLTGLKSHQIALSVTGNNVANVNTDGYTRQQAIFTTNQSTNVGSGYLGQGVNITDIQRIAEDFIIGQLRSDTSLYASAEATLNQAESIDNLLASTTTGLTPSLTKFFESFQGAADDPTSVPQRQLLLTNTEGLVARFQSLNESLDSQKELIDQELEAAVAEINSLAQGLVEINQSIATAATTSTSTSQPNELLDARDETLRRIAELVNVTTIPAGIPGQVNVFIGNGQPLVIGTNASTITTPESPRDSTRLDIAMQINGVNQVISGNLSGGKIGALLDFRDNELREVQNGLGLVALALADTINEQHSLGMDLENKLGGQFFADINELSAARQRVTPNANNLLPDDHSLRVDIVDVGQMTTDTYELRFDGPSDQDYKVVRLPEAEVVVQGSLPGIFPASVEFEGIDLVFESGTFKQGDYFTVEPTRYGARDIEQVIDRVEEIALASPIRAQSNLGNVGSAEISLGTMLDITNPINGASISIFDTEGELSPPLGIRFITDTYYEVVDMSDPSNPAPLNPPMNNIPYSQGLSNQLFTSDPGETQISSLGADTQTLPAPAASAGVLVNGYGAQNLNFLIRDNETGVVTAQSYAVAANSSAEEIASGLTAIPGVKANAYTQVRLSNFTDNGDATPLEIEINGETLAIAPPAVFDPDTMAEAINNNTNLQDQNIIAVSNGVELELRALSGADIEVVVNGSGDSVDVSKLDPYSAGTPVLSTQTVVTGQGVVAGGTLDVKMSNGVSMTADVESVFQLAPPAASTYLGFQFSIQGIAAAGDQFTINYNTDGVSDNRNALAMAQLEGAGILNGGVVSYGESYSKIVEEVGTFTAQARLDEDSAASLLDQSKSQRDALSGVSLDEEAGRLIQFQAAYNASAQVVSVARELFNTLLGAFA